MKIHAIAGMPRSGSTLLCNILNQNPDFHATSTSPVASFVGTMIQAWSNSIEVKAELNTEKELAEERAKQSIKSFVNTWHENNKKPVVFDKSRGWNFNSLPFFDIFPESKIIVMVRDLRSILASCEKQHRKNPLFDEASTPLLKTQLGRATKLFAEDGVIGSALIGTEDLLRRPDERVIFVQYESLVNEPEKILRQVYEAIGVEYFAHDFKDVKDTATDPDGFYLNKFPHHNATGEVKIQSTQVYSDFLAQDVIDETMKRGQFYNTKFGYM